MGGAKVYRKAEKIVSRTVAGERLLVPIRGKLADMQRIFAMNPVAAFLWDELDGTKGTEDLVAALCARFAVGPDAARRDVEEFVGELTRAGLIAEAVGC
jgi:hypothetical protein